MAGEWEIAPLGEIYDFSSGLSKPREEFGFGHGFLSFKDVFYNYFAPEKLEQLVNSTEKEQQSCSIQRGDVFLTRTSETMDELGMSCVALKSYERATFNGFTKRLRPKGAAQIVPEYAGYYFRSPGFRREVTAMSSLSTRASLNNEMLGRLKMVLPPVATQEAIGSILKALDDKIELNRRMNATLEAMARALFQSWFVDFDPVRAKLDDREPAGMDGETARLFPSHFSESELGMIPRGWAVASFSEMFEIPLRNGLTRPKSVRGAGTRMVNMGELFSNRRIGNIEMDRVPLEGEELSRNLLEPGDLLFARQSLTLAGAGQCSVIIEAKEPRTFESHLIRCRLDKQKSNSWFYFYYFLSPQGRARVVSIVEQVAAAGIRGSDLGRMKVLIPPVELQRRFGEIVTPFEQQISANEDQSRTLATLRDTLLPKLLSGELSVAGGSFSELLSGANPRDAQP